MNIDEMKISTCTRLLEIESYTKFKPIDFLTYIYSPENADDETRRMVDYIVQSLLSKNMDFRIEKRKNNDFIITPVNAIADVKNIITFWIYQSSISIRIIQKLDAVTVFRSIEDMESKDVSDKIRGKYYELTCYY